jgi:hypothetical protein
VVATGAAVVAGAVVGWTVTVGKAAVVVTGAEVVAVGTAAVVVAAVVGVTVEAAPVTVGVELPDVGAGVFVTFEGTSSAQAARRLNIVTREMITRHSLKKLIFIILS